MYGFFVRSVFYEIVCGRIRVSKGLTPLPGPTSGVWCLKSTHHLFFSWSFFLKLSSFFMPLTFCNFSVSSVSQVLWIWAQFFHFIKYWISPGSLLVLKVALGSPSASTAYTVVTLPVAVRGEKEYCQIYLSVDERFFLVNLKHRFSAISLLPLNQFLHSSCICNDNP